MSLIDMKWYVIGPPWGDGTWINAGSEDPHGGRFVLDLNPMYDEGPKPDEAAELAAHIVELHNAHLKDRP